MSRHRHPWTAAEDVAIVAGVRAGVWMSDIATSLGRSKDAVRTRLQKLRRAGVAPPGQVQPPRGKDGEQGRPSGAAAACMARPGTRERIEAMRQRYEAGQALWCDKDARLGGDDDD